MSLFLVGVMAAPAQGPAANRPPVITHEAVASAVRGQPLTIKAKVTDESGKVRSVILFYTLSRDAAPFKVPLKPAGLDLYVGTIEAAVFASVRSLSYYLEAVDEEGAARETPWYAVGIREPAAGERPAIPEPAEGSRGLTIALVAGGAAAVIGGAMLLAGSGGDDSGDSGGGGTPSANYEGTYGGTATTCLNLGGAQSCDTQPATIIIDSAGKVASNDLVDGQTLTGQISGNSFVLSFSTGNPTDGSSSELIYQGTVVGNRIVGQVSGNTTGPAGSGIYSGSFSMYKQ